MRINKKGFTLIELMVVISIIAVLASVVVAGLNDARKKANDAKVKSQLDIVRKSAGLYFSTNGDYGSGFPNCTGGFFIDTSGMAEAMSESVFPANTIRYCKSYAQSFAVISTLSNYSGTQNKWCIDSSGSSKMLPGDHVFPATPTSGFWSCDDTFSNTSGGGGGGGTGGTGGGV